MTFLLLKHILSKYLGKLLPDRYIWYRNLEIVALHYNFWRGFCGICRPEAVTSERRIL